MPGFIGPQPTHHYPPSNFNPYFLEPHGRMIFTVALLLIVLVIVGWIYLSAQIKKCAGS